jgi:hypothetical protein
VTRGLTDRSTRSSRRLALLVLPALRLRALIPAGFMPVSGVGAGPGSARGRGGCRCTCANPHRMPGTVQTRTMAAELPASGKYPLRPSVARASANTRRPSGDEKAIESDGRGRRYSVWAHAPSLQLNRCSPWLRELRPSGKHSGRGYDRSRPKSAGPASVSERVGAAARPAPKRSLSRPIAETSYRNQAFAPERHRLSSASASVTSGHMLPAVWA